VGTARRVAGPAFSFAVVAGSYVLIRSGEADLFDHRARRLIGCGNGPRVDPVVAGLTDLGSIYGLGGIAVSLLMTGRRAAGRDVAAAGAFAWVAAQAIKPLLDRPRPYETGMTRRRVDPPAGSSWPSGHAAVAAATAATLAPRLSPAGRLVTATGAALVGVSRLHVGVHHATDVSAGLGVGTLAAAAWRLLYGWRTGGRSPSTRGGVALPRTIRS